jgi:hypothetical protein
MIIFYIFEPFLQIDRTNTENRGDLAMLLGDAAPKMQEHPIAQFPPPYHHSN